MPREQVESTLRRLFQDSGKLVQFKKGEMVFSKDETVDRAFFIYDGLLKICQMTFSGQAVTFFIRKTNDYFGIAEIILNRSHPCYAQCLRDSRLCVLPAEIIKHAMQTDLELCNELLVTMTERLMQQEYMVEQLASKSVTARAAWLVNQVCRKSPDKNTCRMQLTHQELSCIIGCSRQTLSEIFNEWQAEGIICYTRDKLSILQPERLRREL
ncbi:MAG: Crp/Fnr family transcriptional regulator [Sporolactobacillus sp.]|nr:Crp/Fnr family transcriptional regulator [Sporolactobacillus sp.]MCI1882001.1 Crp/Fnr family transcriptional regulator [Sporolactobacillus sp.]